MSTIVFVISDLHLGGAEAANGKPSFQMTSRGSVDRLAAFIRRLPVLAGGASIHLVIAGDIVDFLAEEPFEAFTSTQSGAITKLERIFDSTEPFWSALKSYVADDVGALTLMLGNHDIELSFPEVRERLRTQIGDGRVTFIYDNEALVLGDVLIEHGNRFDAWNAVPHGALRRVRSQMSRRLPVVPEFPGLPGSRLVIDVMNRMKATHPFVDLLKPEGGGAVPIAAALGAASLRDVLAFHRQFVSQLAIDFDEGGEPLDEGLMSANDAAQDLQALDDGDGEMSALDDARQWLANAAGKTRSEAAFRAIRASRRLHREAFDIAHEEATYLAPARRAAAQAFKVVVYGHTHLAKQVALAAGPAGALYLNTGTWADVMAMPEGLWDRDAVRARASFDAFVSLLRDAEPCRWRRSAPTYARLEFEDGKIVPGRANVHFDDDDSRLTSEGLIHRLVISEGDA